MNKKSLENRIKLVLNRALRVASKEQAPDGSFLSLSSASIRFSGKTHVYKTTFAVSNILLALRELEGSRKVKHIIRKGVDFLLRERSKTWSWNYWGRSSLESRDMPYPDDLDDTALALSVINIFRADVIGGKELALIAKNLTMVEQQPGGPYKTWFVPKNYSKWQDVDLAPNVNLGYFLKLNEIGLPNIEKMLQVAIRKGELGSLYYPSVYPLGYFISRVYDGTQKGRLCAFLLEKMNKDRDLTKNTLNSALLASSLLNLGVEPTVLFSLFSSMIGRADKKGFEPFPFCVDPAVLGSKHYSGSRALTAAFVAESLGKYMKACGVKDLQLDAKLGFYDSVVSSARERLASHREIRSIFEPILSKVVDFDRSRTGEVVLFPYYFYKSLKSNLQKRLTEELISKLCLANLYGWVAYKIYDDFVDDEGDLAALPVANICAREMFSIYMNIAPHGYEYVVKGALDQVDLAGTWERINARAPKGLPEYGDYSVLYRKSFGHALGPMLILLRLGFRPESDTWSRYTFFVRNYLIARQLNDDAHDWEEDLERKFINPVGLMVLKKSGVRFSKGKFPAEKLRRLFWESVVDSVVHTILKFTGRSRGYLKRLDLFHNTSFLEKLIEPLEQSANIALHETRGAREFKNYYTGSKMV